MKVMKSNLRGKTRENMVALKDVDIALVAKVVRHGGRFYLTVRPADIEFWGIKAGDRVHFKIDKYKATVEDGEEEGNR